MNLIEAFNAMLVEPAVTKSQFWAISCPHLFNERHSYIRAERADQTLKQTFYSASTTVGLGISHMVYHPEFLDAPACAFCPTPANLVSDDWFLVSVSVKR